MTAKRPLRIANFSGAMGDRFDAFEQSVSGESVDVVFGDSMTEAFESMLAAHLKEPQKIRDYYSDYFLSQVVPQLGTIAERHIKVVTNAGVFNPKGLAMAVRDAAARRGLPLKVAYVTGDDLLDETSGLLRDGLLTEMDAGDRPEKDDPQSPLAVHAYLGCWGIRTALENGSDIVITGRVADPAMVTGPAAWWHGWRRDEYDRLAGATAAAHVLECGPQATGGNFAGFTELADNLFPRFPVAEIAADGSSVIAKHGRGDGAVTVDTVTSQLLYEIQGPRYLTPDVVWHTDSVSLTQQGRDRIGITGAKGSPPPTTTKVNIHVHSGYRGAMWLFPTGLHIDEKIAVLKAQALAAARHHDLEDLRFFSCGRPADDPRDQWEATVPVQVALAAASEGEVSGFLARLTSYWLGSIPGFYTELSRIYSNSPQLRIDYRAALIPQDVVSHCVHLHDGDTVTIEPPPLTHPFTGQPEPATGPRDTGSPGPTTRCPLGEVVYARSGDKGADATLGIWPKDPRAYPWMTSFLTTPRLRQLLEIGTEVTVERYELPMLNGVLFNLKGYLRPSGSANLDLDQIGKALGEFLRARQVPVPVALVVSQPLR